MGIPLASGCRIETRDVANVRVLALYTQMQHFVSAASHHFSLSAIAFKITSCIFIIRSVSAGRDLLLVGFHTPRVSQPSCQADISLAN